MNAHNAKETYKNHISELLYHSQYGSLCGPLGRYAMAKALIDGPSDFSDQIFFNLKEWPPYDFPLPTSALNLHREIALDFVRDGAGDRDEAIESAFYVLAWMPVGELYSIATGYWEFIKELESFAS